MNDHAGGSLWAIPRVACIEYWQCRFFVEVSEIEVECRYPRASRKRFGDWLAKDLFPSFHTEFGSWLDKVEYPGLTRNDHLREATRLAHSKGGADAVEGQLSWKAALTDQLDRCNLGRYVVGWEEGEAIDLSSIDLSNQESFPTVTIEEDGNEITYWTVPVEGEDGKIEEIIWREVDDPDSAGGEDPTREIKTAVYCQSIRWFRDLVESLMFVWRNQRLQDTNAPLTVPPPGLAPQERFYSQESLQVSMASAELDAPIPDGWWREPAVWHPPPIDDWQVYQDPKEWKKRARSEMGKAITRHIKERKATAKRMGILPKSVFVEADFGLLAEYQVAGQSFNDLQENYQVNRHRLGLTRLIERVKDLASLINLSLRDPSKGGRPRLS